MVAHNSEGHVVEKITGHRYDKPSTTYELRVKWKGLQEVESTWESAAELYSDVPVLVKKYVQQKTRDPWIRKMAKQLQIPLKEGGSRLTNRYF